MYYLEALNTREIVGDGDDLIFNTSNNIVLSPDIFMNGNSFFTYVRSIVFESHSETENTHRNSQNFMRTSDIACASIGNPDDQLTISATNIHLNAADVSNIVLLNDITLQQHIYNALNVNRFGADVRTFPTLQIAQQPLRGGVRDVTGYGNLRTESVRVNRIDTTSICIFDNEPSLELHNCQTLCLNFNELRLNGQLFSEYVKQFLDERGFFTITLTSTSSPSIPYTISEFFVRYHESTFRYKVRMHVYDENDTLRVEPLATYEHPVMIHGTTDDGVFVDVTPGLKLNAFADVTNLITGTVVRDIAILGQLSSLLLKSVNVYIWNEDMFGISFENLEDLDSENTFGYLINIQILNEYAELIYSNTFDCFMSNTFNSNQPNMSNTIEDLSPESYNNITNPIPILIVFSNQYDSILDPTLNERNNDLNVVIDYSGLTNIDSNYTYIFTPIYSNTTNSFAGGANVVSSNDLKELFTSNNDFLSTTTPVFTVSSNDDSGIKLIISNIGIDAWGRWIYTNTRVNEGSILFYTNTTDTSPSSTSNSIRDPILTYIEFAPPTEWNYKRRITFKIRDKYEWRYEYDMDLPQPNISIISSNIIVNESHLSCSLNVNIMNGDLETESNIDCKIQHNGGVPTQLTQSPTKTLFSGSYTGVNKTYFLSGTQTTLYLSFDFEMMNLYYQRIRNVFPITIESPASRGYSFTRVSTSIVGRIASATFTKTVPNSPQTDVTYTYVLTNNTNLTDTSSIIQLNASAEDNIGFQYAREAYVANIFTIDGNVTSIKPNTNNGIIISRTLSCGRECYLYLSYDGNNHNVNAGSAYSQDINLTLNNLNINNLLGSGNTSPVTLTFTNMHFSNEQGFSNQTPISNKTWTFVSPNFVPTCQLNDTETALELGINNLVPNNSRYVSTEPTNYEEYGCVLIDPQGSTHLTQQSDSEYDYSIALDTLRNDYNGETFSAKLLIRIGPPQGTYYNQFSGYSNNRSIHVLPSLSVSVPYSNILFHFDTTVPVTNYRIEITYGATSYTFYPNSTYDQSLKYSTCNVQSFLENLNMNISTNYTYQLQAIATIGDITIPSLSQSFNISNEIPFYYNNISSFNDSVEFIINGRSEMKVEQGTSIFTVSPSTLTELKYDDIPASFTDGTMYVYLNSPSTVKLPVLYSAWVNTPRTRLLGSNHNDPEGYNEYNTNYDNCMIQFTEITPYYIMDIYDDADNYKERKRFVRGNGLFSLWVTRAGLRYCYLAPSDSLTSVYDYPVLAKKMYLNDLAHVTNATSISSAEYQITYTQQTYATNKDISKVIFEVSNVLVQHGTNSSNYTINRNNFSSTTTTITISKSTITASGLFPNYYRIYVESMDGLFGHFQERWVQATAAYSLTLTPSIMMYSDSRTIVELACTIQVATPNYPIPHSHLRITLILDTNATFDITPNPTYTNGNSKMYDLTVADLTANPPIFSLRLQEAQSYTGFDTNDISILLGTVPTPPPPSIDETFSVNTYNFTIPTHPDIPSIEQQSADDEYTLKFTVTPDISHDGTMLNYTCLYRVSANGSGAFTDHHTQSTNLDDEFTVEIPSLNPNTQYDIRIGMAYTIGTPAVSINRSNVIDVTYQTWNPPEMPTVVISETHDTIKITLSENNHNDGLVTHYYIRIKVSSAMTYIKVWERNVAIFGFPTNWPLDVGSQSSVPVDYIQSDTLYDIRVEMCYNFVNNIITSGNCNYEDFSIRTLYNPPDMPSFVYTQGVDFINYEITPGNFNDAYMAVYQVNYGLLEESTHVSTPHRTYDDVDPSTGPITDIIDGLTSGTYYVVEVSMDYYFTASDYVTLPHTSNILTLNTVRPTCHLDPDSSTVTTIDVFVTGGINYSTPTRYAELQLYDYDISRYVFYAHVAMGTTVETVTIHPLNIGIGFARVWVYYVNEYNVKIEADVSVERSFFWRTDGVVPA